MHSQQHLNDANNAYMSKDRLRSNSSDWTTTKRMRTGSISGRLRTASDLEELGYIDKQQKGWLKDLIISGDQRLQESLDKFEKGQRDDLIAFIKEAYYSNRKDSIDLLDGLDFDFISNLRTESEGDFDTSYGDLPEWNDQSAQNHNHNTHHLHNNTVTRIPGSALSSSGLLSSTGNDVMNSNNMHSVSPHMMHDIHNIPSTSNGGHSMSGSSVHLPSGNYLSTMSNTSSTSNRQTNKVSTTIPSSYQPKDMTGLLDDSFDRTNRRGSIDALMNEALFDVDLPTTVIRNHVPGGDISTTDIDMDSIFNQFASDGSDALLNHPRTASLDLLLNNTGTKNKKSIRLTGPSNTNDDISPEKVDLSAYASHAMSLQQQNLERKLNSVATPGMPMGSPQKSMQGNLKIKQETTNLPATGLNSKLGNSTNGYSTSTGYGTTSSSTHGSKGIPGPGTTIPSTYMVKSEYTGHGTIKSPYLQPVNGTPAPGTTLVSPYMTNLNTNNTTNNTSNNDSSNNDYSNYHHLSQQLNHNKMLEQHGVSTIAYGTIIPEPVDVANNTDNRGSPTDIYQMHSMMMNNGSNNNNNMLNNGNMIDPNNPNAQLGLTKEGTRLAGYIGAYSPEQRKLRIEKFLAKRSRRVWTRKVKYDVRKNFADSRLRIKGRFVKKEDEDIMRELLSI